MKLTSVSSESHKHEFVLEQKLKQYRDSDTMSTIGNMYVNAESLHCQDILHIEQELVIFLDIDGVLLPETDGNQEKCVELWSEGRTDEIRFDQKCSKLIIDILEEFGAKIRVHSRWRRHPIGNDGIMKAFYNSGFKAEHFSSYRPICRFRGLSSDVWQDIGASSHDMWASIIIDDREPTDYLMPRTHITNAEVGITEEDAVQIRALLTKRIEWYLHRDETIREYD
ncbi:hypothetical protein VCHA53O466_40125 [Vibrio chagasii]|nr:hypothetical protein VCHA53O466_40125 [Vibrio chagasii]